MLDDLSHFRLPDDGRHRTINFSGGRSSAFLLYKILEAHDGQLPDYATTVFANTGKEREETLEFVKRCQEEWAAPIVWLEYDVNPEGKGTRSDPKHIHRVVDFDTASRNGEPFLLAIRARRMIPNFYKRFCTSELKVATIERYLRRELGINPKDSLAVLGIRHDEPKRWIKAMVKYDEGCRTEYPFVNAEVSVNDVEEFWDNNSFDLTIPSYAGNCDLCFLKKKGVLLHIMRQEPERAKWWIEIENKVRSENYHGWRTIEYCRFDKTYLYSELLQKAEIEQELPLEFENDDMANATSCFCGD